MSSTVYAYTCNNTRCLERTRPVFREMPAGDARRPPGDVQTCLGCGTPLLYHGPIWTNDPPDPARPR